MLWGKVRPTAVKSLIIIILAFLLFLLFSMYERAVMSSSLWINSTIKIMTHVISVPKGSNKKKFMKLCTNNTT